METFANKCTQLESDFSGINERVKELYEKIDESFNKKRLINNTLSLVSEKDNSKTALGYFLLREEIEQEVVGFFRIMNYWYPNIETDDKFEAKKNFIQHIIKPITKFVGK